MFSSGTAGQELNNVTHTASMEPMPTEFRRWARGILISVLILSPLVYLSPGMLLFNGMDTPRRLLMLLGGCLLTALILYSWAARGRLVLRWSMIDLPVLLFTLAAILTSLPMVSAYSRSSLFGPVWAMEGLQFIGLGILLYFGFKEFLVGREEIESAIFTMVMVGGVVALLGLADFYKIYLYPPKGFNFNFTGPQVLDADRRLVSTLGNPMFTGTYLAMLIPLGIGAVLAPVTLLRRLLMVACVGLMLVALVMTKARAAWIGLALTLPFLLTLILWRVYATTGTIPRRVIVTLAVALFVSISLIALLARLPGMQSRIRSVVNMEDTTILTRVVYMRGALNLFREHPIQGWGPGNLQFVFPQYRPSSLVMERGLTLNRGFSTALPHNLPLQIAAEMGLLGLLPFLLMVFVLYRVGFTLMGMNSWQTWPAISVLGMLTTYLLINLFAFDNATTLSLFWVGLGLLGTMAARERNLVPEKASLSPKLRMALNVSCLVLSCGAVLHFGLQLAATYYMQRGAVEATQAMNLYGRGQVAEALPLNHDAIKNLERGIALTPFYPYHGYEASTIAHYVQMQMFSNIVNYYLQTGQRAKGDPAHTKWVEQRQALFANGFATLGLMDRSPNVLRFMLMESTSGGQGILDPALQRKEFERAEALASRLLLIEPHSAEVHLIAADLKAAEGDYARAAELASVSAALDPSFSEAYARRAHFKNMRIMMHDPDSQRLVYGVVADYQSAVSLGSMLKPEDRREFVVNLFLLGREKEGIEQGRLLQRTPAFDGVLDAVRLIYKKFKRVEEGNRVIQQLKAGMTPPPATPRPVSPTPATTSASTSGPAMMNMPEFLRP
ncbi:MAG: O-antigen ligase family protein [Armatimonadota bacterium]